MRIVIDLQGTQGGSRNRGMGRYSLSLTQGLLRNRGDHEVYVTLNGLFPETIEPIRSALDGLIPQDHILIWSAPEPVCAAEVQNDHRRHAAELVRESYLASLNPDFIVMTSLFEGFTDNVVTSIGQLSSVIPTASVLYDLIPLIYRDLYLQNPISERWYENKIGNLRNADLLFSISESSRQEAIKYLGFEEQAVVNISCAAEDHFSPAQIDDETHACLEKQYGLTRPFIMYTGGIDHRKNIEGLLHAFAKLPKDLRAGHQLAIVCSVEEAERQRLLKVAANAGLAADDVIMTGFIPEDDLLACYRTCKLFIFPSWHEGFGLPALEAMKCGRPVIASNISSLPEVVGLEEALFDPRDIDAMSAKISEVLTDTELREHLGRHGLDQAKKFSWDATARRAWEALEASHSKRLKIGTSLPQAPIRRPRLAYVSPLPPEASGISDYSAELLPELSRHYRIDVVVAQGGVSDPAITANFPVRDIDWFRRHAHEFDRILYHFGNSHFHNHMFDLLRAHPGVVVLHDFFLSGVIAHCDVTGASHGGWAGALLQAHGWPAVVHRYRASDTADVVWAYPCNLQVIQDALGIIVHSDYSRQLARQWYGEGASRDWRLIPHLRQPASRVDRAIARRNLGLAENDYVICSFGIVGRTKLNHRLLNAWRSSSLSKDPRCHLIFVGQNDQGDYGADLDRVIKAWEGLGHISITGWTEMPAFRQWLAAADVGVQLRTLSRGETSGTVLDCMNAGLATIVNANGSMAGLPRESVWLLDDEFADEDLIAALEILWCDDERRNALGESAQAHIRLHHQPRQCAAAYAEAIEHYYVQAATVGYGLRKALVENGYGLTTADWAVIGTAIARNFPDRPRLKRLYVDVSELVQCDSRSGIQRVVRSILKNWLLNPPSGWIVEPVYAEIGKTGYRHARHFASDFLEIPKDWGNDDLVEPDVGDIFVGLDLHPAIIPQQEEVLRNWYRRGIKIYFVIYDLLPVFMPEFFPSQGQAIHQRWLETVAQFDGVVCISRAVADDFIDWLDHYGPERKRPLRIDWFHLGGDTENSMPTRGMPDTGPKILEALGATPSFLMVGTLEPRKGYSQVLAAFDALWKRNVAANLVLVGKLGWMMEDFARQVRKHPQYGKRLFWLDAVSDEYLEEIYTACKWLIAASKGEGFGLPLIEAARHNIALLVRDLPVFREVAGDGATYFPDRDEPSVIVDAIDAVLRQPESSPRQMELKWQTWEQSAQSLLSRVFAEESAYRLWRPDGALRWWGNDLRMISPAGVPHRRHRLSNGQAGCLAYLAYRSIAAGGYTLKVRGQAFKLTGKEYVEIVSGGGKKRYLHEILHGDGEEWNLKGLVLFDQLIKDLEVRVWVDTASELSIEAIALEPVGS